MCASQVCSGLVLEVHALEAGLLAFQLLDRALAVGHEQLAVALERCAELLLAGVPAVADPKSMESVPRRCACHIVDCSLEPLRLLFAKSSQ